jgi:hypothetical protein
MPAFADSVLQNVTTATGDITLGSPVAGYVGVASRYSANAEDIFLLEQVDANLNPNGDWILFRGTYVHATGIVQRSSLLQGSVALNFDFSAGNKLLSIVPDPTVQELPIYTKAALPTPASSRRALAWCTNWQTGVAGVVAWNGTAWEFISPIYSGWLGLQLDAGDTYWINSSAAPVALYAPSVFVLHNTLPVPRGYSISSDGQKITFSDASGGSNPNWWQSGVTEVMGRLL